MASPVIGITELYNREAEFRAGWQREYVRRFRVETNDANAGSQSVLAAMPFFFGETYGAGTLGDQDFFSWLQNARARCVSEDGRQWEVELAWGPYDPLVWPENPLGHPPDVSVETQVFEEPVDVDYYGTPVLNTAGDPYDPPVMRDLSRSVLVIERNELTYSEAFAGQYRDTLNSDTFLGGDPTTVKCNAIKPTRQWDKALTGGPTGGFYWRVRYEFAQNRDNWHRKVLNAGMRQIKGGKATPYINGVPITAPVPLGPTGEALPPGAPPIYVEYAIYPELEFSGVFNMDFLGAVFA